MILANVSRPVGDTESLSAAAIALLLGSTVIIGAIGYVASRQHRERNPYRRDAKRVMRLSGARRRR